RYDRNRDRHDHAVCTRCGRLLDVTVRLPRKVFEDVQRRTGLRIASHHVHFLGLCSGCAAKKSPPRAESRGRAASG
ncbi:MAG: transcriptional repressor, partial [Terriglobia bacterium]